MPQGSPARCWRHRLDADDRRDVLELPADEMADLASIVA
jgi:hypothetical protein